MPNMSYCRFQNTRLDLRDCYDWLGENSHSDLSNDEQEAFKRMVKLCLSIVEDYAPEILNKEIEINDI